MPQESQSYQAFLQENLTDRTKQKAYLDQVRENDSRFKGLDEQSSANALADISGFEPFRRFAQGGIARGLDAFGDYTTQAAADFRPADVARVPEALGQLISGGSEQTRSSPALEKPISAYTGDVGYGLAKTLGAEESTANAFRLGGEQAPVVIGQLGLAAIPVVGAPAMFTSMYGQGLNQAYAQGEFGPRAHVAASVGPIASALTIGLARPLTAAAANKVMSFGTSEALRAGMKKGGEVGLKTVMSNAAISGAQKVAMKAGQELLVGTAQAGIGIVADITQNAILDPKTFFESTIKDKNYWIPMLMSEVIEGGAGTIMGRMHKPIDASPERAATEVVEQTPPPTVTPLPKGVTGRPGLFGTPPVSGKAQPSMVANPDFDEMQPEGPKNPKMVLSEKTPEAVPPVSGKPIVVNPGKFGAPPDAEQMLGPAPDLFSVDAKLAADVDPTTDDSDQKVVAANEKEKKLASDAVLKAQTDSMAARINPDLDPTLPISETNPEILPAETSTFQRDASAHIDVVARSEAAMENIPPHDDQARIAVDISARAIDDAPPGADIHQVLSNLSTRISEIAGAHFKDHRLATDEGNSVAFRNPGTKEVGVLFHFIRKGSVANPGQDGVPGGKLILMPSDMLLLDESPAGRAAIQARSKLKDNMTDAEWGQIVLTSRRVKEHANQIPFGVSFAEGHDPEYARAMTEYIYNSGIQTALINARKKLRFGAEARKLNQAHLQNSPLDYFFSTNKATNISYGDIEYINRNEGFSNETDPHELGHTVGRLIGIGGYGSQAQVEWNGFLNSLPTYDSEGNFKPVKMPDGTLSVEDKTIGKEGAMAMYKAANNGRSPSATELETYRKYYLQHGEIEAQIFQGYFLDTRNRFVQWIEKTFPTVHNIFKKMFSRLNVVENATETEKKLNLYSPEYRRGRELMAGILGASYSDAKNVAAGLKDFVRKQKITGRAVEALTHTWYSDTRQLAHQSIKDLVKIWKSGFDGTPAESDYVELIENLATLSQYNRVNIQGHAPAGEAFLNMPWIRKIVGGNMEEMYNSVRAHINDPSLNLKLNEAFLSPEEFTKLKASDPEALKNASMLVRNRELLRLNSLDMAKAISERLAVQGENRPRGSQVVKQMFLLDNVVKKWMLGRLPGQNGIPFFDTNNNIIGTELSNATMLAETTKSHSFHKWFPILSDAINKGIKKSQVVPETFVTETGEINFDKAGKKSERKSFDNRIDAEDYAATMKKDAINSQYNFFAKREVSNGKEKFFIRVREGNRDTRYIDEAQDADQIMEQMAELLDEPTPLHGSQVETMTPADAETAARNARRADMVADFVKAKGPLVSRKLSDVIPTEIKYLSTNQHLNKAIKAHEAKFEKWIRADRANMDQFLALAEHFDIAKKGVMPIDVAAKWIELHLDEGKPQQKKDALFVLNWLSPTGDNIDSGLNDYITSMENYARRYADVRMKESMGQISRPSNQGHVPEISPSELGGEARLAGHHILNDPDVASGAAAAIVGQPGGFQGRKSSWEQTKHALKYILGRPLKSIQSVHDLIGTGAIQQGLSEPLVRPLSNGIYMERGNESAWVNDVYDNLYHTGEFVTLPDGTETFVQDGTGRHAHDNEIERIQIDPKRNDIHNEMLLLEQTGGMKFADILAGKADERGQQLAKAIWDKIPVGDHDIHRRALIRRYSAKLADIQHTITGDKRKHIAAFAVALNTNENFDNSATRAHDFAQQFALLDGDGRVSALINTLKLSSEQAFDIMERYRDGEIAMATKHEFLKLHPEYVSEKRMKDFHVGVVFQKGKDGNVPTPGYYDFDSYAEAQAFSAEQIKLGNKPGKIKDYASQKWNYKQISGSLQDIMDRVITQRREMVSTMLYGKVDPETQEQIVRALQHIPEDINTENDVVLNSAAEKSKRKFVAGREDLDMLSQFKKTSQRSAASSARKETDLLFKLQKNDAAMKANQSLYQTQEGFKDGVRIKDSEMQKNIGKAGYLSYIFGSISTAVLECSQFPIVTSPILMEHGASVIDAYRIPMKMMKKATHAAFRRLRQKSSEDIWEGEHAVLLKEWERQGRSNNKRHNSYSTSAVDDTIARYDTITGEKGVKNPALHIGALTYKFINDSYHFFNRINSEMSLVASYEVLKKTKYGKTQPTPEQIVALQNDAMMISDVANGQLQNLGRPGFTHSRIQGVRNASSMYWSLQSFANAQIANQLRFMQKSINFEGKFNRQESVQARKALVGMLGAQFTGMGIMGFTLMPSLAKVVQQAFGYDIEDELKELLYNDEGKTASEKNFMGDVATNGLLTTLGSPIDFGPRMSVGGGLMMNPHSGIDLNTAAGPLFGLVKTMFKDMGRVQAGEISLGEASLNLLPMGLRRGIRMSFIDQGKVYDTHKNFRFNATGAEQFGAWLNFNTPRYRQMMKSSMERDEAMKSDMGEKGRMVNEISTAQKSSPTRVQSLLMSGAEKFGMKPYDFANYVASRQVDKQIGPNPREGAGPASQLAKKLYPSPVPQATEYQRQIMNYSALAGLGVQPRISNTALTNARRQDYMLQLDPTMTTGTARSRMRDANRPRMGFSALMGDFD
jgi:hypothetical protein